MPSLSPLTRRPQATVFSIEDLLDRVRRGEVRVPEFQRPLRWKAKDVLVLLDSIYRGYPIGTLLFWKKQAPASSLSFGPVHIDAPYQAQSLWVVDGQQRITALTGVLLHPPYGEDSAQDDFTLFFDLEQEEFARLTGRTRPPPHWLPMNVVLDSELLLAWLDRYSGRAEHPGHTRAAMRLGKAIREYQVPVYIVEAGEEKTLRVIFERLNSAGKPLRKADVFNALHGDTEKAQPSDLRDLARSLETLGFGALDQQWLLKAVLAIRGLDITRDFRQQLKDEHDLVEALRQTERTLRDVIVFIKRDVGIPHIELLPYKLPLVILARFFHLHPQPSSRSRELLARWVWRGAITGEHRGESIPGVRRTLSAVGPEEEKSVKALLAEMTWHPFDAIHFSLTEYNFRSAQTKLQVNALLSLRPRDLRTGEPLDVTGLVGREGASAFRQLFTSAAALVPDPLGFIDHGVTPEQRMQSLANRIFHPPVEKQSLTKLFLSPHPPAPELLRSHAITPEALEALRYRKDATLFLDIRGAELNGLVRDFQDSRARWGESDRPSLQSLIVPDEED